MGRSAAHANAVASLAAAEPADPAAPKVCLLGLPRLVFADGTGSLLERKDAALLALLATAGVTPRARAASLLWPEAPEAQARSSLRQRLFRLRRQTRCELVRDDGGLRLADAVDLDIDPSHAATWADGAFVELLGAHDYADLQELDHWVRGARLNWRNRWSESIARLASEHETAGHIAAAIVVAQRLLQLEPLLEHAHRRLMRLHYLRGDRAAALAVFERCASTLQEQLGVQPGAETRQLVERIAAGSTVPGATPARPPVNTLRPPRLVGREAEWSALQTARVALISGEPGIGKSRLLGEIAADRQGAVVHGARPGDASLPHALLARVVRGLEHRFGPPRSEWARRELARIVPELGEPPETAANALRLQQALDLALADWRADGLSLLAIDDLHFADDASLELLMPLMGSGAPMAWLLAARAHELPESVSSWLASAGDDEVQRVPLAPLDASAVQALLESLALPGLDAQALALPLHRHTGGNPLFVLETLIAMLDGAAVPTGAGPPPALPAPARVGALIDQRLARLDPAALKLARLAAVAGQDFSAGLAAAVLGQHVLDIADHWRALENALVIRDGGFAHDLIFEATLRSVPKEIARELHRAIAVALEAGALEAGSHEGSTAAPVRLAEHWKAAEQWSRAGACFLRAAELAFKQSQRRAEGALAAQAAECFQRAGDRGGEFRAHERRFNASRFSEPYAQQRQHAEAMLQLADGLAERLAALEALATTLNDDQQDQAAYAAAHEAGELARALGDAARELSVARLEARALSRMNRQAEALAILERTQPAAWQREGDSLGASVLVDLGATLIICDRPTSAAVTLQRALDMATALQDWSLCHEAIINLGWAQCCAGRLLDSTLNYERAGALKQRLSAERSPTTLHSTALARQYKELGRFAEALSVLDEMLADQRSSDNFTLLTVAECEYANLCLWLGQPARATAALKPPNDNAAPTVRAAHLLARARIARSQGRLMVEPLQHILALVALEGRAYYRLVVECELARQLPVPQGAALALRAVEESEALQLPVITWPLKAVACDMLRRDGLFAQAAGLARQIMDEFEHKPPITLYAPEYWWFAHLALAAAGDAPAATAALQRARHWIEHTALPNVPEPFRDSFLHRNPVNRTVLTAPAAGRTDSAKCEPRE